MPKRCEAKALAITCNGLISDASALPIQSVITRSAVSLSGWDQSAVNPLSGNKPLQTACSVSTPHQDAVSHPGSHLNSPGFSEESTASLPRSNSRIAPLFCKVVLISVSLGRRLTRSQVFLRKSGIDVVRQSSGDRIITISKIFENSTQNPGVSTTYGQYFG